MYNADMKYGHRKLYIHKHIMNQDMIEKILHKWENREVLILI